MYTSIIILILRVPLSMCSLPLFEFSRIYTTGITARNQSNWGLCVQHISTSISLYRKYKNNVLQCKEGCKHEHVFDNTITSDTRISPAVNTFFKRIVAESDCVNRCMRTLQGMDVEVSINLPMEFESLEPYLYLHHCLYMMGRLDEAASAVYTFLLRHPENEVALTKFAIFKLDHDVPDRWIRDLEEKLHVTYRKYGENAFKDGDWNKAVMYFEKAISEYFMEEEKCRSQCEIGYREEKSSDSLKFITDTVLSVVQCQLACTDSLTRLHGQSHRQYLADHFLYLQLAYYHMRDYVNAIYAASSYLALKPEELLVKQNKAYFMGKVCIDDQRDTVRQDVHQFMEKRRAILALQDDLITSTLEENTVIRNKDSTHVYFTKMYIKPEDYSEHELVVTARLHLKNLRTISLNQTDLLHKFSKRLRANITATGKDLKGENRVILDDVLTKEQCASVIQISKFGQKNAGYHPNYPTAVRPDFVHEHYSGLDITDCWKLVLQSYLQESDADLLMMIIEKARLLVINFYNESGPLYNDYTQFTRREALTDKQSSRTNDSLSHPIHGDSCDFRPNEQRCAKETAAYPWRKYSAVMYFNGDFEGGQFFFANPDQSEQVSVVPKCGRLVIFPSDHLHGVKAVTKGVRYAATIWFTSSEQYVHIRRPKFASK